MSGVGELVALVDRLQAEAREQAAAAAMWQERAGTLADRLAAAESKLLALAAPQSPPEAPGAPASPDPPTEEPGAPWWRWIALLAPVLVTALVVAVVLLVVPR